MQQILILGGGAAGLAAALAAAQTAEGRAHITVLDKNAKVGKKLLATGNGRCNLDNRNITPERYFTSSPKALRRLLSAVDEAAPLAWFESLGLYPRTDEAGRVYPYSNQAADVLALLEHHLSRLGVEVRTGCTVQNLSQSRGGYAVQIETEAGRETLRADAVICAMGGDAGPQFGTDGFGTRFAAQCGGRMAPLYPCLTALQCAHPRKPLAGIRAKGCASLLDGADGRVLARETGEVQFTEYGLSGICIMQLSGLLAPGRGPKRPVVALDLFPALSETELAALFAQRVGLLGSEAAEFWLGLLPAKLGRALWADAGLPENARALPASAWPKLAATAKCWRFEGLTPCGWKQAQTTGGGLFLDEVEDDFQFKVRDSTSWARRWTAPAAAAATTSTGPSAAASSPGGRRQSFAKRRSKPASPRKVAFRGLAFCVIRSRPYPAPPPRRQPRPLLPSDTLQRPTTWARCPRPGRGGQSSSW